MLYRPRAPQELVDGYRTAAGLATRRATQREEQGESREAEMWQKLAEYCQRMADTRALDDDQYERLRRGTWHRPETPMTQEQMARQERDGKITAIWETENRGIPEWKWAAMELALGYLAPLQRVCFEMKEAGGLSYNDIGDALNMHKREVQATVAKARKKFRKKIAPMLEHIFNRGECSNG